jgi:hypothetical protein
VESLHSPSRDHQREKRESPSVDSPGNLCEVRTLDKGLPKNCHWRKIDSVFLDNDAKMLLRNLYFFKAKGSEH